MENQENWLILGCSDRILDELLVLAEKFWVELDVTRLVYTVNVTESSGNGEVRGDRSKSLVNCKDVFGLSVERVVIDGGIVNTILLTSGDTDLLCEG